MNVCYDGEGALLNQLGRTANFLLEEVFLCALQRLSGIPISPVELFDGLETERLPLERATGQRGSSDRTRRGGLFQNNLRSVQPTEGCPDEGASSSRFGPLGAIRNNSIALIREVCSVRIRRAQRPDNDLPNHVNLENITLSRRSDHVYGRRKLTLWAMSSRQKFSHRFSSDQNCSMFPIHLNDSAPLSPEYPLDDEYSTPLTNLGIPSVLQPSPRLRTTSDVTALPSLANNWPASRRSSPATTMSAGRAEENSPQPSTCPSQPSKFGSRTDA